MSAYDLFQDLWRDASDRARQASEEVNRLQISLIKHQASHRSLLAHLRSAAQDLAKTRPIMSQRYRDVCDEWETYCAEPQKSLGEVATPAPSGPTNEARGREVPQAQEGLESPQGIPVSDSSAGIPAPITYSGEWDGVKS